MRTQIIQTKIKQIDDSLNEIAENLPTDFPTFSNLGLIKDGIYKKLEFCIETVFDICAIINTDLKVGIPESDENIIDNLIRKKIITKELGELLKTMKGFRNILVHRYGTINDEIAYTIIKEQIQDFYTFIEKIEKIIEK